jgi:hypothetical protein
VRLPILLSRVNIIKNSDDFLIPAAEIHVGDNELMSDESVIVTEIKVSLTIGKEPCSAVISMRENEIETAPDFLSCVGKKVIVKLGYEGTKKTEVFNGYLHAANVKSDFSERTFILFCLDAKGVLRETDVSSYVKNKNTYSAIEALLKCSLVDKSHIETPNGFCKLPAVIGSADDFLYEFSQITGYRYFFRSGEAYFIENLSVHFSAVSINDSDIISVNETRSLTGQMQSVTVFGYDKSGKKLTFSTKNPNKLPSFYSQNKIILTDYPTSEMISTVAKKSVSQMAEIYNTIFLTMNGLPEMLHGSEFTFGKNKYFAASVEHIFDSEGYRTYIKGVQKNA